MSAAREAAERRALAALGQLRPGVEYAAGRAGTDIVARVFCRLCFAAVRQLTPLNDTVVFGGEKLRLAALGTLPAYRDLTLLCADGSQHHTCVCAACLPRCLAADAGPALERVFAADLAQWLLEERRGGSAVAWEREAARRPVGAREGV